MIAQLLCRLTLLKVIPLFGKTNFSQLTGTKTKSLFLQLPWQSVGFTSAVIVSDDRSHSRDCVIVFLEHIIKELLNENITALHIWSDGPSSQFKNRHIAAFLSWLQNECSIKEHGIYLHLLMEKVLLTELVGRSSDWQLLKLSRGKLS